MNPESNRIRELKGKLEMAQDDLAIRTAELEKLESERDALQSRTTSLQCLMDQRWEMMRELEAVCETKDVAKAVEYVNGLKARVKMLEDVGYLITSGLGDSEGARIAKGAWKRAKESKP